MILGQTLLRGTGEKCMKDTLGLRRLTSASLRRFPAINDVGIRRAALTGRLSVFTLLPLILWVPFASAQVSASLSGIVTDQSGAAVSAAAVAARNLDTGLLRSTVTDQAGRYQLLALPVGRYEVRVRKDGFAQGIRTGILLVVGQDAKADLTLRLGPVSQEVKVTGDAAL